VIVDTLPHFDSTVEVGIDWLTCTARRPLLVEALLRYGEGSVDEERGAGAVEKPWRWQGYMGRSAGGSSVGFDGHTTCLRLSGPSARENSRGAIALADNVSRLDVQLTVVSVRCGADYAERLYRGFTSAKRGRGRPIAHSLIQDDRGGSSVYFGRRISDQYGRIYNKSAEEKELTSTPRWRYEIEYKRRAAVAAARSYAAHPSQERWCLGEVYGWFDRRGATPPISPLVWPGGRGAARGAATEAAQLRWLKVGVRPVLLRLAERYGWLDVLAHLGVPHGAAAAYLDGLGLDPNGDHVVVS